MIQRFFRPSLLLLPPWFSLSSLRAALLLEGDAETAFLGEEPVLSGELIGFLGDDLKGEELAGRNGDDAGALNGDDDAAVTLASCLDSGEDMSGRSGDDDRRSSR